MKNKKSILLTNFQLLTFTGSELDTLTIANYFLNKNYDVSIFVIEYGYPLVNEIDDKIKIINSENIENLKEHYDIIWAHHFPLLDYLLFDKKVKADYIHYVSLSSYNGYEALPEYYKELNLISVLSYEGREQLKKENIKDSKINYFTNYTLEENFKHKISKHKLDKICIISNHIPEEILGFSKLYEEKEKKKIDIYGEGYKYEKITPSLLEKYDLVITIGRTVNDALALGIPVYCYDHFGGDSFITKNNAENAFKYNFSGRFTKLKYNKNEIYNDIIKNYNKCTKDSEWLREFAYNNFCFESMMEQTLKKLQQTKKFNINDVHKKYPQLLRKGGVFYKIISNKIRMLEKYKPQLYYSQIYFDFGDGFNEKNSTSKYYKIKNNNLFVTYEIPKKTQNIRFDFSSYKYTKINNISINDISQDLTNLINCKKYNNSYISINDDPGIIVKPQKTLKIKVDMEILNPDDYYKIYYQILEKENKENNKIFNKLKGKIKRYKKEKK